MSGQYLNEQWLTVNEYAKFKGISTKTVYRRVKEPMLWGLELKRTETSVKGSKKVMIRERSNQFENDFNQLDTNIEQLDNSHDQLDNDHIKIEKSLYNKFISCGGNNQILEKMLSDWINENEKLETSLNDDIILFKAAYQAIGHGRGFVRIHKVREFLSWSKKRFNRTFKHLIQELIIELHGGDPSIMTKQELDDSWIDERTGFLYLTLTWWGKPKK